MVSDNLARAVVSAIVADDAKALKRAWLAFGSGVPQDLASKFVKQAWNHDRAMHPCTAALLEGEHMLATIYSTIADLIPEASEQSQGIDGNGNAGLLLFSVALETDDDTMAPLAWLWSNGKFHVARPATADEEGDA